MRLLIPLLCGLSLYAADLSRPFELRRTLQQTSASGAETLFYRAAVSARFGDERAGIEGLRRFLAGSPERALARKAWEEMASASARIGLYKDAAEAWTKALALTPQNDPERGENENTRALYAAFGDVAPQTIEFTGDSAIDASKNRLGSWNVPVEINGHRADWIFDTGANLTTISESGAREMGLEVRETRAYVNGSTGAKNALHLAVANGLRLGPARLNNVALLVISDQALYIGPLHYRIQGILGLPVIRALGVSQMSAEGSLRILRDQRTPQQEPNLFFDELRSIVEIRHGGRPLQMYLDTGANKTDSYPSIRAALTSAELSGLKREREKSAGAGGALKRSVARIPLLRLELAGRDIELKKIDLFDKQPSGGLQYYDGVLGMDALAGGFTLDYQTMRLLAR
jgi:predicted aspartyl protease